MFVKNLFNIALAQVFYATILLYNIPAVNKINQSWHLNCLIILFFIVNHITEFSTRGVQTLRTIYL